jgi:hypothetical protein
MPNDYAENLGTLPPGPMRDSPARGSPLATDDRTTYPPNSGTLPPPLAQRVAPDKRTSSPATQLRTGRPTKDEVPGPSSVFTGRNPYGGKNRR